MQPHYLIFHFINLCSSLFYSICRLCISSDVLLTRSDTDAECIPYALFTITLNNSSWLQRLASQIKSNDWLGKDPMGPRFALLVMRKRFGLALHLRNTFCLLVFRTNNANMIYQSITIWFQMWSIHNFSCSLVLSNHLI